MLQRRGNLSLSKFGLDAGRCPVSVSTDSEDLTSETSILSDLEGTKNSSA